MKDFFKNVAATIVGLFAFDHPGIHLYHRNGGIEQQ